MAARVKIIFDHCVSDLARAFNGGARMTAVSMPRALHDDYLDLYSRTGRLCDKLRAVDADGEHELALEEWRRDFRLPAHGFLRPEIEALRATMKSFDPYRTGGAGPSRVTITTHQAQGFFDTFSQAYDVVHDLFEMFRKTDYMRLMRHLRDVDKIPYAGPAATREITAVYFGLARVHRGQRDFMRSLVDERHDRLEAKVDRALSDGGALTEFLRISGADRRNIPEPQ